MKLLTVNARVGKFSINVSRSRPSNADEDIVYVSINAVDGGSHGAMLNVSDAELFELARLLTDFSMGRS